MTKAWFRPTCRRRAARQQKKLPAMQLTLFSRPSPARLAAARSRLRRLRRLPRRRARPASASPAAERNRFRRQSAPDSPLALALNTQVKGWRTRLINFADRLAALVPKSAAVRSASASDPAKLAGEGETPDDAEAPPPSLAAPRIAGALPPADRTARPRLCRDKAAARLLRAPRRSQAGRRLEATCDAAREAGLLVVADGGSAAMPRTAPGLRAGAGGETPDPLGPVTGLGANAFTADPLLGCDALSRWSPPPRQRGAGHSPSSAATTPRRDLQDLPPRRRRCTSASPASSTSSPRACSGVGPEGWVPSSARTDPRHFEPHARADAALGFPHPRRFGARKGGRSCWRRFRRRPRRRPGRSLARIAADPDPVSAPSACAPPFRRFRPPDGDRRRLIRPPHARPQNRPVRSKHQRHRPHRRRPRPDRRDGRDRHRRSTA